ncbi:MAG: DUF1570 domain-containing protein [Pirellulaceae bacterium]
MPSWIARVTRFVLLVLVFAGPVNSVSGQDEERTRIFGAIELAPEMLGVELPEGEIVPYASEHVWTTDENGSGCVARVHVKVGNNFIVKLPDGQLVGRLASDVDPTERPFEVMNHAAMAKSLLDDPRLRGFQTHQTDHFVFVYNASPEFARVTASVMETMLEGVMEYCTQQGIEVHEPDVILPVIMFHTDDQFQAYERVPRGIAAYYAIASNRVILKQESSLAGRRDDLAEQQLLSTIAHEGAHQILHNIGVQQRLSRWPMWLGEGIAEYMAPTKLGHKFAWKGAGKINDMRMWDLEGFLQMQFVKGFDGDTVTRTVSAASLSATGYASAWTITHYLAEQHKEKFDRYMCYLSRMPPLQGMYPEDPEDPHVDYNLIHFKKFFGDDVEAFENAMVEYMARQKYTSPVEAYPHYVGTAVVPGLNEDTKHCCFYPDEGSLAQWTQAVKESLSEYEQEHVKFEYYEFPNRGEANRYIRRWKRGR